jgi:hypothetical protein
MFGPAGAFYCWGVLTGPRLRQVALVAHDCGRAAAELSRVFGWAQPFRDPGVGQFGLAPGPITVTPDGKTAYVVNLNSRTATPIRTATDTALKPIKAGAFPSRSRCPHNARQASGGPVRSGPPEFFHAKRDVPRHWQKATPCTGWMKS